MKHNGRIKDRSDAGGRQNKKIVVFRILCAVGVVAVFSGAVFGGRNLKSRKDIAAVETEQEEEPLDSLEEGGHAVRGTETVAKRDNSDDRETGLQGSKEGYGQANRGANLQADAGSRVQLSAADGLAESNVEKAVETGKKIATESEAVAGTGNETADQADPETEPVPVFQAEESVGVTQAEGEAAREDGTVAEGQAGFLPEPDPLPAGTVLSVEMQDAEALLGCFTISPIVEGDGVYNRINGKSWQENPFLSLDDLRYVKLLHYNFDGQIQVGELIVNKSIAEDVRSIFLELFAAKYQIQSMYLIDRYWTGDPEDSDTASVDENNSSAFCYRPATDGKKLSKHAYGKAIDINPQQNPYVSYMSGSPKWYHENANDYIRRDTGLPHVITHEDTAFLVFSKYGFFWGGDWKNQKDYQHFQKG